jgi:hypothetical protein
MLEEREEQPELVLEETEELLFLVQLHLLVAAAAAIGLLDHNLSDKLAALAAAVLGDLLILVAGRLLRPDKVMQAAMERLRQIVSGLAAAAAGRAQLEVVGFLDQPLVPAGPDLLHTQHGVQPLARVKT